MPPTSRALAIQEQRRLRGVGVAGIPAAALPLEESQSQERIGEVGNGALVQAESVPDLRRGHRAVSEGGEKPQLDGGKESLGCPESHPHLQNVIGGQIRIAHGLLRWEEGGGPILETRGGPGKATPLRFAEEQGVRTPQCLKASAARMVPMCSRAVSIGKGAYPPARLTATGIARPE